MIRTGVDAVEIQRFEKMEHLDAFVKRVFGKAERAYFDTKKTPYESIAAHFAAKEAFSKYMGCGMRGFGWRDIEVLHDELGKPYLKFLGKRVPADLSITHSNQLAVAVVTGDANDMEGSNAEHIKEYRALLPKRKPDAHKGDCGKVFAVAGSNGMTGAAALTALSAYRTGCGLVTVGVPDSEQPVLATMITEAMTLPLPSVQGMLSTDAEEIILEKVRQADACILGPGLGNAPDLWKTIETVVQLDTPMVLDADGLNGIKEHIDILKRANCELVLTPHMGEMARLCGLSVEEIEKNRETAAREFASRWGVTLLLKGKDTVIASPRGEVHINPTGNPGMATGGMGDVLSGIIGSLLAQGLNGYYGAVLGAFLHGLAGDIAAKELGEAGMIASDVLNRIPRAILTIQ